MEESGDTETIGRPQVDWHKKMCHRGGSSKSYIHSQVCLINTAN